MFQYPLAENLTRQGVTTAIGGQDGSLPYPIGDFLAQLDGLPSAVNFGLMVGHGTIRRDAMGNEDRAPTAAELDAMKAMVGQAMAEGAFGLSSGLKYVPGAYAETEEVVELARVAGYFGGIYISHIREEGLQLLNAVRETIRIGEEGRLPTQITHHKVLGAPMWGRSTESLALVDDAPARGVDVPLDQYPYTTSSTGLTILFPAWSLEGSRDDLVARLNDTDQRRRIKEGHRRHAAGRPGWQRPGKRRARAMRLGRDPRRNEPRRPLAVRGECTGYKCPDPSDECLGILEVAHDTTIGVRGEPVPRPDLR